MGMHVCKIMKGITMENAILVFGAFALIVLLIHDLSNKQGKIDFHVKFNLTEGFQFDFEIDNK